MMLDERDLDAIAMFPLPNLVLLPGALIPLHIFEPRYREMTRDVLQGSQLLALARLSEDHADDRPGRPAVLEMLGIGRVLIADQLDDGRYNLLVRGLIRARVVEELPSSHAYRMIHAVHVPDVEDEGEPVLLAARQQLITLCDRLSQAMERGGDKLRELVRSTSSPSECADLIAAALISDPDARQNLLETLSPLARLTLTMQHVNRMIVRLDAPSGPPN